MHFNKLAKIREEGGGALGVLAVPNVHVSMEMGTVCAICMVVLNDMIAYSNLHPTPQKHAV